MKAGLAFLINIFRYNKGKIALFLFLTLFFVAILFPYRDLSSLVTSYIAKSTGNQVFVAFDDMGFSLLPQPGLKLEGVQVESSSFPSLKFESLTLRPGFWNLPSGTVLAQGFMGGNALVTFKTKRQGEDLQSVLEVSLDSVSIKTLTQILQTTPGNSFPIEGNLSADLDLSIPQSAPQNLKGTMSAQLSQVSAPTFSANSPMGPIDVPSLRLSELNVQATMDRGVLQLENVQVGQPGDSLSGKVQGQITLRPASRGQPTGVSSYDLNLDLTFSQEFLDQPNVGLFTGLMDSYENIGSRYRSPTSGGVRYAFRISAANMNSSPRVSGPTN